MRFIIWLFSISGRMPRLEYFIHSLVSFVIFLAVLLVAVQLEDRYGYGMRVAFGVTLILYFITETIATIKRLHDLDRSGAQVLLFLVPAYNFVLWLKTTFEPGTDGPNTYGPDPLRASAKIEKVSVKPFDLDEPKWPAQSADKKDNQDNKKDDAPS